MSIFRYLGEFFLFRWLFGSRRHNEPTHNMTHTAFNPVERDYSEDNDSHISPERYYADAHIFLDDQDYEERDYDDLDYEDRDYDDIDHYDSHEDYIDDFDILDDDF